MIIRYVIKQGDTLLGIAKQFKIAPCGILMANGLPEMELVKVGKTVLLPINTINFLEGYSVKYIVQPADTLQSIALKFGTTADKIKASNNISAIFIGQELTLGIE